MEPSMNLFARRAALLAFAAAVLAPSVQALDDAAFNEIRAGMSATRASAPRILAAAAAAATAPSRTFTSLRADFQGGRRPEAADLRLDRDWTCYSLRENGAATFDRQTFVSFDGRIMSRGTPEPSQSLEYKANPGSIYASFKTGKRDMFTGVAAYRVLADGRLVRELTLLYPVWFGGYPAGVRYEAPLAIAKEEFGSIARLNTHGTVYTYAVCEPAAR
jgi:hypothetical protein